MLGNQSEGLWTHRKKVVFAEGHETDLLQSFHPSCAIHNTERRPEFRALLIHHFVTAFSVLSDESTFPDSVEEIRKLCLRTGNRGRQEPTLEDAVAADVISTALQGDYRGAYIKPDYRDFADNMMRNMESFDTMYAHFQRLLGSGKKHFWDTWYRYCYYILLGETLRKRADEGTVETLATDSWKRTR